MGVGTRPTIAVSDMLANDANEWVMEKNLAMSKTFLAHELHPKYLRYNIWDSGEHFLCSSADWSETASPLPTIPASELANPVVAKTINENPDLFDIVTPIFIDRFKELLNSHPNCEGFWPWADTHFGEYPDTLDYSLPDPDNPDEAEFLCNQRDHEIFKGRFSESFGNKLLPGMYCMPIFAVPKPHSTDLRMVTDQSAGKYSLNSMIRREDIIGYPLDNLHHLGEFLLSMHHRTPHSPRVLYKSDVAEAYRLLPVHPFWQIKQINWISGNLHVDRNNAFRGRGSGCNWIAFMSLVSWIAKKQWNIELLGTYSDDSFGLDHANNLAWYPPYNKFLPKNQVKLLQLWDKINLPHKKSKQIYGSSLTIIGIEVDANALSMTMPPDRLRELISAIDDFISSNHKFTLHEWQRLAGWINWSFNVFPLLRPCLNNFYAKISGKCTPNKYVRINNAVCMDLTWAARHLDSDKGVCLIHHIHWDISSADVIIYCNACLDGMGFWLPDKCVGYYSPVPDNTTDEQIFYFEALCVLSAIHHATDVLQILSSAKVLIYTDNNNSVSIFNALRCLPHYNPILIDAADVSITSGIHLRVLHIPGELNYIADAISRKNFLLAHQYVPDIVISSFIPPRLPLGAPKK